MGHDIRELARKSNQEIWFKGQPDAIDKYFADDFRWQTPMPGVSPDRSGYKQFVQLYLGSFDDLTGSVQNVIVEGDLAVIHWLTSARHSGDFMGIKATNRHVQWTGITLQRYRDGKVAEEWSYPDAIGLMGQLDALPNPAGAGVR